MRPTLGILDPENTRTCPKAVAASAGLDVLSHALESFTARHYLGRERPERPSQRSAYQGANPISDVWALEALRIIAECLPRAYKDPSDDEARGRMLLAASYAGIGFGNAGVHLPHAMAYPVAGNVEHYQPAGTRPITRWCRTGRRSSCIRPQSAARPHLQRPSATCRRRRRSARTFVT